jgi:hypothetical protein
MDEQFQKLITENLTIIMNFRRELTKETDRGCALMAASFLDYELEKLLREKLVGSKNHLDTLFEFNGPLGTFSSRIRLSYSLGLIPKEIMLDLEIIRKVRNEFGHKYEPIYFDTSGIKDRLLNLKSHAYSKGEGRPRDFFTNTVYGVLAEIHVSKIKKEKFGEADYEAISDEFKGIVKKRIDDIVKEMVEEVQKKEEE